MEILYVFKIDHRYFLKYREQISYNGPLQIKKSNNPITETRASFMEFFFFFFFLGHKIQLVVISHLYVIHTGHRAIMNGTFSCKSAPFGIHPMAFLTSTEIS